MKTVRYAASVAALALFYSSFALAQTPPPATPETTDPSSASSPSQRDTTKSPSTETPPTSGSNPADASTPHQREAMAKPQTMKECMDTQAAKHPAMSKSDMTKACNEQMKAQKEKHQY